jgi:broad specificity phosphatase PhoE
VTLPLDLVLVRHGESEGNEAVSRARAGDASMLDEVRTRHSSFWQLTARGREQAAHSGRCLRDEFPQGFDLHHSSEYVRAMQTAALLDLPGAEWLLHPDLRERSWGDLDRLTPEERREHFSASLQEKASAPFYWRPPNGESIAEVSARLIGLLHTLRHHCPQGRALLVCHGETIGALRAKLEQMSQLDFARWSTDPTEKIANGEVIHYSRRDPAGGEQAPHLAWRRSIVPWDPGRSQPWARIARPHYDADALLAAARRASAGAAGQDCG